MEHFIIYLPAALALLGLLFMFVKAGWVGKQDAGEDRMQFISKSIKEGAMAFLKAEYKILFILNRYPSLIYQYGAILFYFVIPTTNAVSYFPIYSAFYSIQFLQILRSEFSIHRIVGR